MNNLILSRFMRKVEVTANCWLWKGGLSEGYGKMHNGRKTVFSHRLSYQHFVGDLKSNMTLDHLCRNRLCVNPAHLEQVSLKDNLLRGISPPAKNARKTHCSKGHELIGYNIKPHISKGKLLGRSCRKCCNRITSLYRAKRRKIDPYYHSKYIRKWREKRRERGLAYI